MSDKRNSLSVIFDSSKEIERLLSEHKYNIVMLKSKQLIDYIARKLAGIHQIHASDSEIIDILYADGVLSRESLENYQRIRLIGVSAIQNDDDSEYNAKTSFQLLNREIDVYLEIIDQTDNKSAPILATELKVAEDGASKKQMDEGNEMEEKRPVKRYREEDGVELKNPAGIAAKINRARTKSKPKRNRNNLIRLGLTLAPILGVLILILLVWFASKSFINRKQATATTAQTSVATDKTEATLVEEPTAVPTITRYVTTSALNVRSAPSTDGEKLTTLPSGTTVDFVGDYDDVWAIINYNGTRAYVSKQYLKLQE